jgi:hypothetical protein
VTDQSPTADDDALFGDPIPEVFPPDDATARFVVSMSMANNDIDRTFRDLLRSHDEDGQDFTYRLRLSVGHLVEAIDALNDYSRECPEVRALLKRVPAAAQEDLKAVRGTLEKAGPKALQSVRDNTFHYPSPAKNYNPTSDEKLRAALAGMGNRGTEFHLDGDTKAITLTFADDAAIGLAMGKASDEDVLHRFEVARDGALAFMRWATELIRTYMKVNDQYFGEPIVTEKKNAPKTADSTDPAS